MDGRKPPASKAAELLRLIRREIAAGRTPTLGVLFRKLGKSKTTVAEGLNRLERDGWIKRPPLSPGKERPISLSK